MRLLPVPIASVWLLTLCFFALSALGQPPLGPQVAPAANNNGFQNDGTVSNAIWQIESALTKATGCSIPSQIFSSQDANKKAAKNFDPLAFHDSLMSSLGVTPFKDSVATYYDGFVTRLFDTPSTNSIFGTVGDDALLGIVSPTTDTHAILLWGVGTTTVKYDCNSMLKLSTSANADYSYLSLATLQASFNASKNGTATNSLVIVTGRAQSLFDLYNNDADPRKNIFANMQAIAWEEGPLGSSSMAPADRRLKYISTANIISFASTSQLDSSSNVAASISASVNPIPMFQAKGDLATQLTQEFQQMNSNFTTFVYNGNTGTLPPLSKLLSNVQGVISLGNVTPLLASFAGSALQISGSVSGWPAKLCNTGQWSGSVTDTANFTVNSIALHPDTPDASGWPVCDITFSVKIANGAAAGTYDPGLKLAYALDKQNVSIQLPLAAPAALSVVNTPTFTFVQAQPVAVMPPNPIAVGVPISLLWRTNGSLSVAGNFLPTQYSIAATPQMPCTFADGSTQPLTINLQKIYNNATLATDILNPTLSLTNPDRLQTLGFGIQLPNASTFDVYAPSSQLQTCNLAGNIQVNLTDQAGHFSAATVPLTVTVPFPPKRAAMSIKGIACIPALQSHGELSLGVGGNGEKCTLNGNDLDIATGINLSIAGQAPFTFPLTIGQDSGTATFSLSGTDVKKFVSGTVLQVIPVDNSGATGSTTVSLTVVN